MGGLQHGEIDPEDLGASDGNADRSRVKLERTQNTELPIAVDVVHIDEGRDYQSSTVTVRKQVGRSDSVTTLSLIEEKESFRWLGGGDDQAASLCAGAESVTVIADREGDIDEAFALRPEGTHLLVRAAHDRCLAEGAHLFLPCRRRRWRATWTWTWMHGLGRTDLAARSGQRARTARLSVRFAGLELARPRHGPRAGLPATVPVNGVDLREKVPPAGATALH